MIIIMTAILLVPAVLLAVLFYYTNATHSPLIKNQKHQQVFHACFIFAQAILCCVYGFFIGFTYGGGWGWGLAVVFFIYTIILFFLGAKGPVWILAYDKIQVVYRTSYGKVKTLDFSDIQRIIIRKTTVTVCAKGRKIRTKMEWAGSMPSVDAEVPYTSLNRYKYQLFIDWLVQCAKTASVEYQGGAPFVNPSVPPDAPIDANAVKVIWSTDEKMFGEVLRRQDGAFQYRIMKLFFEEMYNGQFEYYWAPYDDGTLSIVDAQEKAENQLAELLNNVEKL